MPTRNNINNNIPLQTVMDTILDGLVIIDKEGAILNFNRAASNIFGYTADEVIGQNVKMLMPNPYHKEHDGYISNYIETNDAKVIGIGREVSAKRKNGNVFPIELGVNKMKIKGELLFVGMIKDITEKKESEEKIRKFVKALRYSNQELDDFAYIASHDLKEPLRGLSNNALFLKEDYEGQLGDDGVKRLERIQYLCERMEKLVDDLLYFSRIGRQELAIQETNLKSIVVDIKFMMEAAIAENNVEIKISDNLPEKITCDVPKITELYRNLITNAIKYNKSESKIIEIGSVSGHKCKHDGINSSDYVLYVRDNGIGIKEEFYDEVFRIFKRLNDEDESIKGTGSGLTFVKKIVERHGGIIWIEPNQPKGTTFYFTIPKI